MGIFAKIIFGGNKKTFQDFVSPMFFIPLIIFFLTFLLGIFLRIGISLATEVAYKVNYLDRLFAISRVNEKTFWAVGSQGLIIKSGDEGETWERVQVAWQNNLNSIAFIGNQGWIVGGTGLILHSSDGGKNWAMQNSDCKGSLMKVLFLDEHKGFAIGTLGTILHTENGGMSWQTYQIDWEKIIPDSLIEEGVGNINFYDIFFVDKNQGWIVGDFGMVFHTSNGGLTWEAQRVGYFGHLFSLFFKDQQNGWAAGQSGSLLHTIDGGKTWDDSAVPTKENLYKVYISEKTSFLLGDKGVLLTSVDGGRSWNPIKLDLGFPLPWFLDGFLISNASPLKICVVGRGLLRKIVIP